MQTTDLYEGLQRGVVDCTFAASSAAAWPSLQILAQRAATAKLFQSEELQEEWASTFGSGYAVNLDTWNSFPDEVKQIFVEASAQLLADITRATLEGYAEFAATTEESGVVFTDPTELNEVISKQQEEAAVAAMVENAPAGLNEPEALITTFRDHLKAWEDKASGMIDEETYQGMDRAEQIRQSFIDAPESIDWDAYVTEVTALLSE